MPFRLHKGRIWSRPQAEYLSRTQAATCQGERQWWNLSCGFLHLQLGRFLRCKRSWSDTGWGAAPLNFHSFSCRCRTRRWSSPGSYPSRRSSATKRCWMTVMTSVVARSLDIMVLQAAAPTMMYRIEVACRVWLDSRFYLRGVNWCKLLDGGWVRLQHPFAFWLLTRVAISSTPTTTKRKTESRQKSTVFRAK